MDSVAALAVFRQYGVFAYIRENFDYTRLSDYVCFSGVEHLVREIDAGIQQGKIFAQDDKSMRFVKGRDAREKYDTQDCMNSLVMMVVATIRKNNPGMDATKILEDFVGTETYALLCDTETGLWEEGPGYIIDVWNEEKEKGRPFAG